MWGRTLKKKSQPTFTVSHYSNLLISPYNLISPCTLWNAGLFSILSEIQTIKLRECVRAPHKISSLPLIVSYCNIKWAKGTIVESHILGFYKIWNLLHSKMIEKMVKFNKSHYITTFSFFTQVQRLTNSNVQTVISIWWLA